MQSESNFYGDLYVADTYNHRIKIIDSQSTNSRVVRTENLALDGFGNAAQLDEPSGLSGADGTPFIADTNNHRIRTLDVATGELAPHFTNQQAAALSTHSSRRNRDLSFTNRRLCSRSHG